ncbi:MAG TPA: glycosyltransferase family 39 protein, partial [bacterium]|nr:glycosyltransferase family 39 protein [bacterium]
MSDSTLPSRSRPGAGPAVFVMLLVLAAFLRLAWVSADPTTRISWSNGIFTDPPVMVHAARNHALFGEWILDYNRDLWIFPLMNGLTRLAYAFTGPGRVPTVMVSALAGVLTVAAVAWALRRTLGNRAAVLGAALGATSYFLVMFSRIPIAENVVAALLATAAALCLGRGRWELAAAGALAVGATLFGKYHAVGALPGLVLFVALRPGRWPRLLAMVGGGTAVFLA